MYTLIIFSLVLFLPLPLTAASARRTGNGYRAVFDGTAGVAIAMLILFLAATAGGNPVGQALASDLQLVSEAAASNNQLAEMMGVGSLSLEERVRTLTGVYTYAINALPSSILIWAAIVAYFEYMLVSKLSQNGKHPLPKLKPLRDFSMPRMALWGWIAIYLLTFIVTWLGFMGSNVLQINVQMLFQFAFQVQGISVVFYFCHSKKWSNVVAVIVCLLFFPTTIGQMLLCMLGFLDLGFGLRKIIVRR